MSDRPTSLPAPGVMNRTAADRRGSATAGEANQRAITSSAFVTVAAGGPGPAEQMRRGEEV
jgi:hypothetical protein